MLVKQHEKNPVNSQHDVFLYLFLFLAFPQVLIYSFLRLTSRIVFNLLFLSGQSPQPYLKQPPPECMLLLQIMTPHTHKENNNPTKLPLMLFGTMRYIETKQERTCLRFQVHLTYLQDYNKKPLSIFINPFYVN